MSDLNATQQAALIGQMANQVLEERGLESEDRLLMWKLMAGGSEVGLKTYKEILLPALIEAEKRVNQEQGIPGVERS